MSADRLVKVGFKGDASSLVSSSKTGAKAIDDLGREAVDTGRDLDGMGRSAVRGGSDLERLARGAESASRSSSRLARQSETLKTQGRMLAWGADKVFNQYTAIGASVSAGMVALSSANLDKSLTSVMLTAGATREEADALRKDLFRMGRETGQPIDELLAGFNSLVQSGQSWASSVQEIDAMSKAMAVGGADARSLADALGVASTAFQFDLEKPGLALNILDKMRVAGKLGNAEMENLSSIFGRMGVNASMAGLSFEGTLAFIETLSRVEKQPERLATLADSTLRLFTNLEYMKDVSKATGIRFFDVDGNRRDVAAVLGDMRKQFRNLKTEKEQTLWIGKAFGQTDLDTRKGIASLLGGDMLDSFGSYISQIEQAAGAITKDLPTALDNPLVQAQRLRATLRESGDEMAKPINAVLGRMASVLSDNPETTKHLARVAVELVAVAGAITLAVKGAGVFREFKNILASGSKGGLKGVSDAIGRGSPVYVTNWREAGFGGMGGAPGKWGGGWGNPVPSRPSEGIPTGSLPASRSARMMGFLTNPAVIGTGLAAAGAIAAFAEEGATFHALGRSFGGAVGTALGSFGGPLGMLIGQSIGDYLGGSLAGWMESNADEYKSAKDRDAWENDRTGRLEAAKAGIADVSVVAIPRASGVSRSAAVQELSRAWDVGGAFSSASKAGTTAPVSLTINNRVDQAGRTTTTVEGPGAHSALVRSAATLTPEWR